MDVLVLESELGVGAVATAQLEAAGHRVLRCHEARRPPVPLPGSRAGSLPARGRRGRRRPDGARPFDCPAHCPRGRRHLRVPAAGTRRHGRPYRRGSLCSVPGDRRGGGEDRRGLRARGDGTSSRARERGAAVARPDAYPRGRPHRRRHGIGAAKRGRPPHPAPGPAGDTAEGSRRRGGPGHRRDAGLRPPCTAHRDHLRKQLMASPR